MDTTSVELSDDGQFNEIQSNGESIGRKRLRAMGINPSEQSAFGQSLVKFANTTVGLSHAGFDHNENQGFHVLPAPGTHLHTHACMPAVLCCYCVSAASMGQPTTYW
jgi:hypothetical protein